MANQTYADMGVEVQDWLHERVKQPVWLAASNDAVESLWMELMQVSLSVFLGGPTQVSIAAASERVQLISVSDPVAGPALANVAGGALAAPVYWDVRITFVTDSGTETLESPKATIQQLVNNVVQVASPVFAVGAAFPRGAYGYNVYAGLTDATLVDSNQRVRQNDVPILFGASYTQPVAGWRVNGNGIPPPQLNTTADDIAYIQQIDTQLSNGTRKSFAQADIGSTFMRGMMAGIASPNEYQSYAFDFINGDSFEIRPRTAAAINPEYFFVRKPRRVTNTGATIPFSGMVHWAFLRYDAMAKISLGNREFFSANGWRAEADRELGKIKLSLGMQNNVKNTTVRPYRP